MVLMDFEDSCTCFARVGHVVDLGVVCVGLCAWTILTRALRALCSQGRPSFILFIMPFMTFFLLQLTKQSCHSLRSFWLAGASQFFFLFVWCVCSFPELVTTRRQRTKGETNAIKTKTYRSARVNTVQGEDSDLPEGGNKKRPYLNGIGITKSTKNLKVINTTNQS